MTKQEALNKLNEYDSVSRKIINSLFTDEKEIPEHIIKGLKNEHERSFQTNYIMGSKKLIDKLS